LLNVQKKIIRLSPLNPIFNTLIRYFTS
jgi:hypothetical protein